MNRLSCSLEHAVVSIEGAVPAISQKCSPWRVAVPASALPPSKRTRIRDENRFSIAGTDLFNQNLPRIQPWAKPQGFACERCNAHAAELLAFGEALKVR